VELEPSAIDALLSRWPIARLVTLRADGAPAPVPVVFARVGDALYSPIDGKPKGQGALARERHLDGDPRVALLLDHYEDDWERLWWLRVEGTAEVVPAAEHAAAHAALRAKYPQYARVALTSGEPRLLRIAIARIASWRASARAGI
jgi:PPOX class probable F420-dependent enzyme